MTSLISQSSLIFRSLLAPILMILVGGCQIADMASFAYANATATHVWADEQQTTTVPFTLIDNHIVIPVSVNGSAPLNFVLDSGAGATVIIDSRSSRALGLELAGELPVSGVGDGPDPVAYMVPETTVAVGEVSLVGQSAIYLPLDSIPFFTGLDQVYFDGVIGAPFFARMVVEIDYDRRLVSFTEPAAAVARLDRLAGGANGWKSVPLHIDSGVPYLTANVAAGQAPPVDVKLLVDTGMRGALSLTPDTDDRLVPPSEFFVSIDDGLSGEVTSHVAMADALTVAGFELKSLPVSYALAGGESSDGSNGILGNEVLQQFNVIFDYAGERLLLSPNREFASPIQADRSGLQLRPHAEGGLIKRIATDTPGAASGLAVGDIITRFDDRPLTSETLGELKRVLASDRDTVRLCWQAGSGQHCEELALVSRFGEGG